MRMVRNFAIVMATVAFGLGAAVPAAAQPLGSFRWQLQPYCNIITVAVVQQGGQYQLHGTDDQCGAVVKGSVVGLAFQNPNGLIGFGLTIVTAPGGTPVHVDATISITTLSGTWRDSAGNNGTFIFTPGAGIPGAPRPVLPGGIPPLSITNVQIANNTIGGGQINTAEVQARVTGNCPAGAYMIGVNADGTVACTSTARSGEVLSGHFSEQYAANAGFILAHGSYYLPLPNGVAAPTLEYVPGAPTATCPGIGQAGAGRLCIYAFNTLNISSVSFGGGNNVNSRRYGFSLDVFPTTVAASGYIVASWAYRVP